MVKIARPDALALPGFGNSFGPAKSAVRLQPLAVWKAPTTIGEAVATAVAAGAALVAAGVLALLVSLVTAAVAL